MKLFRFDDVRIHEDCARCKPCEGGLFADPYIHINGNSVRLSAGSALLGRTDCSSIIFILKGL